MSPEMPLDHLVQTIRADTTGEVEAIRQEAETRAADIEAQAQARREALFARELEALQARLSFEALRERSTREIEVKRALLQERELLLDEVRQRFEEWLSRLPAQQEKQLLVALLRRGREVVPEGSLILSRRSQELVGAPGGAWKVETDDSLSGLRLRSPDGCKVVDLSLPTLVKEFWGRRRLSLAQALLGDATEIGEPDL